jgi:hypothetical protein
LPDSAGRIDHLALSFGNKELDKDLPESSRKALLEMYGILFRNMSPHTRFTVVAATPQGAREVRAMAERSGVADRTRILDAHADSMSIWIRDSMIPLRREDGVASILIPDRTYWIGKQDGMVPRMLGSVYPHVRYDVHPLLRMDGGNVMSNLRETFVGADSIEQTRDRLRELAGPISGLDELVPELLTDTFGRKISVVCEGNAVGADGEKQPAFHIDMIMTPIGEHAFTVGDPRLALEHLAGMSKAERAHWNRVMAQAAGVPAGTDIIGGLERVNGDPASLAKFDRLAAELHRKGYDVERVPYLNGERRSHLLPYMTYNNCLQERYREDDGTPVQKIYLPQYGCEPLDASARATYERLGYVVVPLPMTAITILEGAIRCSAYPLERSHIAL